MNNIKKKFGQTTISGKGGGGGTAVVTPESNLFYIVGGNDLQYLGVPGIKHVTSTIDVSAGIVSGGWDNGVPATLPDGIGWIRSLDNNAMKLAFNDSTSYVSHDLSIQVVYAVKTATITITGGLSGATWSYDKYTICGAV